MNGYVYTYTKANKCKAKQNKHSDNPPPFSRYFLLSGLFLVLEILPLHVEGLLVGWLFINKYLDEYLINWIDEPACLLAYFLPGVRAGGYS